jgi:hypothetical protein
MKASRYAVIACLVLAACHRSGGGGGGGGGGGSQPPPTPPQTYAAKVTAFEAVRAADALALPVDGLPSSAGGSITVTP